MHISFFRRYRFVTASALILSIVPTVAAQVSSAGRGAISQVSSADQAAAAQVSSADQAAANDTRTYLQRLERLGFSGAVLVARGDKPIFAEGFGFADRERGTRWTPTTVSDIGSITKQFTGAAILKLEEEGRLSVTDPIGKYFPGVPDEKSSITLHHLMTHSSGLSDPDAYDDWTPVNTDTYLRAVLAQPLRFKAGDGYSYANANFSLLGIIIEKLSGKSYESFVRERLFLPANMSETGYLLPRWGDGRMAQGYRDGKLWGTTLGRAMASDGPYWALRANGGIHSTAHDMLRWARALLEGRVLAPASMKKYWTGHVNEGGDSSYGYGWSINTLPGTKVITHNGGNGIFFADMAIVPDADLVVFLMTNVISENRSANALLRQLGMRFLAGAQYPSIPEIVELKPSALQSLAGTYRLAGDGGAFHVTMTPIANAPRATTAPASGVFIEASGRHAFDVLNSVSPAPVGRLDKLTSLMERIIAANFKGDFEPLSSAYGGRIPTERLKARWAEVIRGIEESNGRVLRHEVLGSARTSERDETVVRFHCERGTVDRTWVWDLKVEGNLLGMSGRGLAVKQRLFPTGQKTFFTWDGGIRAPKPVRIDAGPDRQPHLVIGGESARRLK
ncbi:MAG TPA: serine hydrolase domain-containing protein [Pyrinomonadaceae bacterium]|nr:serine hydrolase domain-containing protein [Pyrinomonadaceae bacterium]